MLEAILLGTGTPIADRKRCGSGVAIVGESSWILVDCGRGVSQRAIEAGLDLTEVAAVLLTHHHSDHVSDLPNFAIARWTAGGIEPLKVIAPAGPCARFVSRCLLPFEDQAFYAQAGSAMGPRPEIDGRPFVPTEHRSTVMSMGPWRVESALVDHQPIEAAVGYRISDHAHVVAVSGDTAVCDGMARLAADADLLIHEALNSNRVSPDLLTWNAGARTVGELATTAGVGRLVLTHLLPPPQTEAEAEAFANEAQEGGYRGPIDVAIDLLRIPLHQQSSVADRT